MIELSKEQIKKILPFYKGETPLELQFALELQYAYNGENPFGKPYNAPVYADDAENPNILLIGTGWMYLSGNATYDKNDNVIYDFFINQFNSLSGDDKRIFLQLCSPGWDIKLEKLFGRCIKDKIIRHNYRLNKESFSKHTGWQEMIPAGFECGILM